LLSSDLLSAGNRDIEFPVSLDKYEMPGTVYSWFGGCGDVRSWYLPVKRISNDS